MNNKNSKYREYKNSRRKILLSSIVLCIILIVFLMYVIQSYIWVSLFIGVVCIPIGIIQFYYFYNEYITNKNQYEREENMINAYNSNN